MSLGARLLLAMYGRRLRLFAGRGGKRSRFPTGIVGECRAGAGCFAAAANSGIGLYRHQSRPRRESCGGDFSRACFYLDQPVGKGYLELRDAEWDPVRTAYEVQRDPTQLRRPACLQIEPLLLATAERAAAAALQMRCPELRFVALADEASATRHNQPLDVCRCDVCRVALVASCNCATARCKNSMRRGPPSFWTGMALRR